MVTWSLCMIVRNEESVLERCLSSCKDLFDEIILVDTGSTDKTKEIGRKFTDKIYDFVWVDDFSRARNEAFSKASCDYIMWLDADDVILEEDYKKLKELKKTMHKDIDCYMMQYDIAFDQNHKPTFTYARERLIKRTSGSFWVDPVHEYMEIKGTIQDLDIAITHKKEQVTQSDRNLKIYEKMEQEKRAFTPRNYYYYGRELRDHGFYEKSNQVLKMFLAQKHGWVEDKIAACYIMSENAIHLKQREDAFRYLVESFVYDPPRAKACTLLGNLFLEDKKYKNAIFWYQLALLDTKKHAGFCEPLYQTFLPWINLCACYYSIGEYEKAKEYHDKCKKYDPNHPIVLQNDRFFKEKF